jgi:hypothetical protein
MRDIVGNCGDTVMSRSVYNRETTVKHCGDTVVNDGLGPKASCGAEVSGLGRKRGRSLKCVLATKSGISATPVLKIFTPNMRHNVVFCVALSCIMSFKNIFTTLTHNGGQLA